LIIDAGRGMVDGFCKEFFAIREEQDRYSTDVKDPKNSMHSRKMK
jgi:hypothetical protein